MIFLSMLFFLPFLSYADSNGIWVDASDIRSGDFGSDESLGNFTFSSNLIYKGTEVDARFVNSAEANSITSGMIVDSTITSNDVGFNYAGSSSKGGDALNSLLLEGRAWNNALAITTPSITDSDNSAYGLNPSLLTRLLDLNIYGDLQLRTGFNSCGSLSTDVNGLVTCSTDAVNDADSVIGNEYPLAGTGISVSGRTVSIDTGYTQRRVTGTCSTGSSIRTINSDGTVICQTDTVGASSTDTNAGTICVAGEYLDGDGSCKIANNFTDSNAQTICNSGEYLDGSGICVTDADSDSTNELPQAGFGITVSGTTVNVDTSVIQASLAGTLCPSGQALRGFDASGNKVCELLGAPGCTVTNTQDSFACFGGDVTWYDNCGSPSTTKEYCNGVGCSGGVCLYTYTWKTSAYGICNLGGCNIGSQTRSVWCERNDGTTVLDSFCTGTKPQTAQICGSGCFGGDVCICGTICAPSGTSCP